MVRSLVGTITGLQAKLRVALSSLEGLREPAQYASLSASH